MSTLRVLLHAAPDADRADAWALYDANDRAVRTGRGVPSAWPAAERNEAVLAAACVRIVSLHLPPMPADRLMAAAAFALEDQLAGPIDEQHIAVSRQHADGTVEAIVANRGLVAHLAAKFDRVLAEPALAPLPSGRHWRWYASGDHGGFVRRPNGNSFATGDTPGLPGELTLALDHAGPAGDGPVSVETAFAVDAATKAELAQYTGTPIVPAAAWRWDAAGSAAFAAATDLCQGSLARATPVVANRSARLFRLAAIVAAAAVGLHVAASIGDWAALRIDDWRVRSALASVARDAGVTAGEDPAAGIAKRHAEARHRAGLAAPNDALPLLARAAPALAAVPAGVIKSASYADGHWTLDLAKADDGAAARLAPQLANAGLTALSATNAAGTRIRVSLAPGVQ